MLSLPQPQTKRKAKADKCTVPELLHHLPKAPSDKALAEGFSTQVLAPHSPHTARGCHGSTKAPPSHGRCLGFIFRRDAAAPGSLSCPTRFSTIKQQATNEGRKSIVTQRSHRLTPALSHNQVNNKQHNTIKILPYSSRGLLLFGKRQRFSRAKGGSRPSPRS